MANVDAPFGLKPVRHLNGMSWNGHTQRCYISANDGTATYAGDPVIITATTADRETTGKYLTVERATAGDGNYITGVVISVELEDSTSLKYRAASTARYVNVCTDPDVIYHIQDDNSATSDKNLPGTNAVVVFTHAGSTYTGQSGCELDMTTPANNASFQLQVLRLADIGANALGANAIWEVLINLHSFKATGDGDGALGIIGA